MTVRLALYDRRCRFVRMVVQDRAPYVEFNVDGVFYVINARVAPETYIATEIWA